MLRLQQRITINGRTLSYVQNVTITNSRNTFTDTAVISIQNRIWGRNRRIGDVIKKGSTVKIELGYFPNLVTEFEGYVSEVIPEKTAIIKCENEAYNLKRISLGADLVVKQTDVVGLFTAILEELGGLVSAPIEGVGDIVTIQGSIGGKTINLNILNSNIGDWKVSKTSTIVDVMAQLQSKFRFYCYFRGGDLYIGAQADTRQKKTITAHFQRNVPLGESSFNFKDASADRIVVKATNITRAGVINNVFAFYDGNPAVITFSDLKPTSGAINEFNIGGQTDFTKADLRRLANIRLEALSFVGCDGSIVLYGKPSAIQGDICNVIDFDVPEKNGEYAIVAVIKRFGVGVGYRQELKLGISI